MKKIAWTKGSFRITPYGISVGRYDVFARANVSGTIRPVYSSRTRSRARRRSCLTPVAAASASISRAPLPACLGGSPAGGKLRSTFFGSFVTTNQPSVRLRHVYWEAKNEDVRFLAGETWDLVSPLLPNTVNFSVAWGAGNVGFRRTQARVERYFHLSDDVIWTVQGAVAHNVIQDFTSGVADVRRESGNWPMLQGRTALTMPGLIRKRPSRNGRPFWTHWPNGF